MIYFGLEQTLNYSHFKLMVFELTMHFKHEMIGIWQRFNRNFELTVFELSVPDLYIYGSQLTTEMFSLNN